MQTIATSKIDSSLKDEAINALNAETEKSDDIYVHDFESCSDEELQKLRIEERYAPDSRN